MHDYAVDDLVYVEMNGIYRRINYSKQVPYIITEVSTNGTVRVQWVQVNKHINIKRPKPHFFEYDDQVPHITLQSSRFGEAIL